MSSQADGQSAKRESWIAVGKHKIRIPTDIHTSISRLCESGRYSKHWDALLYAASIGFRVLEASPANHEINVDKSDRVLTFRVGDRG